VEISQLSGTFGGSVAVSTAAVFVGGADSTFSIDKSTFEMTSRTVFSTPNIAIVSNPAVTSCTLLVMPMVVF
jgi:hypothetical protein